MTGSRTATGAVTATAVGTGARHSRWALPVSAAAVVLAVHAAVALVVGPNGCDDGSITVAFLRTFAVHADVALTPVSERVEGFSSVAWFALLSAVLAVVPLGFTGAVALSQLLAALMSAGTALLLVVLLRPHLRPSAAWVLAVVAVGVGPALNETVNGMEMSALSLLALLAVWALRRGGRTAGVVVVAVAVAAPAVRLESAAYVVAGLLGLAVLGGARGRAAATVAAVLASVLALTAGRWLLFGELVPNTLLAKRFPPYSASSGADRVAASLAVLKELALVAVPGAAAVVLARLGRSPGGARAGGVRSALRPPHLAFAAGWVVGVAVVNLVIGVNWGYVGRMEQSAVGPLVVVAAAWVNGSRSPGRGLGQRVTAVGAVLVVVAAGVLGLRHEAFQERLDPAAQLAVSPSEYRQSGEVFDAVRRALGRDTLTVLVPDVGGTALCCTRLRILDLGLLANPELAREGFARFPEYLAREDPDVVETHEGWSAASGIYATSVFRERYTPVVDGDVAFYLRDDLLARLAGACRPVAVDDTLALRNRGQVDDDYVRSLGLATLCSLELPGPPA